MKSKNLVSFEEFRPMIEQQEKTFFSWLKEGYNKIVHGLDTDKVIVISGKERIGKTTLALRIIYKLNKNFDVAKVSFDGQSFRQSTYNYEKSLLLLDEGGNALYSGDSMTKGSKKTIKRIMEMGYKNNIVFMLIPNYFKLHKDIRERRVGALIHITNKKRFYTYNERNAQKIGKERLWSAGKPLTAGYWNYKETTKEFEELWEAYKKREKDFKDRNDEAFETGKLQIDKPKEIKQKIAWNLYKQGVTFIDIAKALDMSRQTIARWINEEL